MVPTCRSTVEAAEQDHNATAQATETASSDGRPSRRSSAVRLHLLARQLVLLLRVRERQLAVDLAHALGELRARAASARLPDDRLVGMIETAVLVQQLLQQPRWSPGRGARRARPAPASAPSATQSRRRCAAARDRESCPAPTRSTTCSKYAGRCSSTRTSSRSAPTARSPDAVRVAAPNALARPAAGAGCPRCSRGSPLRRGGAERPAAAHDTRRARCGELALEHLARHAGRDAGVAEVHVARERIARRAQRRQQPVERLRACVADRRTSRRARGSGSCARRRRSTARAAPRGRARRACATKRVGILALGQRHHLHRRSLSQQLVARRGTSP